MIGEIMGKAKDAGKGSVIITTSGGVGYIVGVQATTKEEVLKKETCSLFTHTLVKKDAIEIFGFLDQENYSVFLLLITVSGIGPKKAMSILETMSTSMLLQSIQKEDVDTLVSFGIGKKQAQRIILDLQKKTEMYEDSEDNLPKDVIATLIALGYGKKEIVEVLKNINLKEGSLEEKIKEALKAMRNKKI